MAHALAALPLIDDGFKQGQMSPAYATPKTAWSGSRSGSLPDEAARLLKTCDASAETRLDGLVTMAEATLRGNQPERPPVEVLVQIDAATLVGQEEQAGISAETSRRLLCDAGIVPVLTDAQGTPLDVGRKSRSIPAALRRALAVRDRGCRFPVVRIRDTWTRIT